jgi:hypothetical protein
MTEPPPELDVPGCPRGPWWKQPLAWSLLLSAGLVVYELTAEPVLGVVLVCSKVGWTDLRLAYRLWRVDPNRPRAVTMSSLYVAYGLTKIGIMAAVIFYGAGFICGVNGVLQAPQPGGLAAANFGQGILGSITSSLVTCVAVFALAAVATGWGFWHANRFSIRVWLGPYFIHRVPFGPAKGRLQPSTNCARMLIRLGLAPIWLIAYEWFISVVAILNRQLSLSAVVALMLVPAPIALAVSAVCYRAELRKLTATKPVECWGTDLVGAIMCMKVGTAEKSRWLAFIPREYWRTEELACMNLRPMNAGRQGEAPTPLPDR